MEGEERRRMKMEKKKKKNIDWLELRCNTLIGIFSLRA